MKKIVFVICLAMCFYTGFAQNVDDVSADEIPLYFDELKAATSLRHALWDMDLYGALILINPNTGEIYANEQDSAGTLVKNGAIYKGILPENINFANTAIDWNGKRWAMVMLPLPKDRYERINLLAHESFHRVQPELGFTMDNAENNHLDEKDGRIYLRLELEALEQCLLSSNNEQQREHLTNAFIFRKYRNNIYPQSVASENLLELNEGIAEYTGQVISGRNEMQAVEYLSMCFKRFVSNPTYVRSFAYQTVPAYAFILRKKQKDWNRKIKTDTNLIDFFMNEFKITIPDDLEQAVSNIQHMYKGDEIISEETQREEEKLKIIDEYRQLFIERPRLIISLENMNISFNPMNIVPLGSDGNVYPTANIIDNWGNLAVSKGMLLSSDWRTIYLSAPSEITDIGVTGDGWSLNLKEGYKVIRQEEGYLLVKQE